MIAPWESKQDHLELAGDTRPDFCRDELLHEIFEAQARRTPDNVAVIQGSRQLTYRELDDESNRLAHLLRARGAGRGTYVGILVPRSADAYVCLLAVLKSGAAYVPLDPEYPADRVGYILADCGVRILLTHSSLAAQHSTFRGTILACDQLASLVAGHSPRPVPRGETGTTAHVLCYVIYTSGSTGKPKGVQIEHASAAHLVRAEEWLFRVTSRDRVYQGFSLAFDASVEEIWLAFAAGAALVVGTRDMLHAGGALSQILSASGITVLSCVPTLLAMLDNDIPSVRLLIVGGETCSQDLVRRWCRPGRRMVNTYGPTEATVIATFADCHPDRPVTIGRPLPNYRAEILDASLHPVAAGETGELFLGGRGLARGYVGRPELTRERFVGIPQLANGQADSRLYKTGDLARRTAEGEIEFLGRADSQVKIRGYRVELSEIEAALVRCPDVQAAVVAVRETSPGLQQLVAYVIPERETLPVPERIRSSLRASLPAYMIPGLIETVESFPTLASGKVDRTRLPAPRTVLPVPEIPIETRSEIERELHTAWTGLFAPVPVALADNFFLDLGGHSLLAARMVSELRQAPRFARLSMLDIYNQPTIQSLAAHLDQQEARNPAQPAASVETTRSGVTRERFHPVPTRRHVLCGLAQGIALYFILGFFSLQWLAPYLTYTWMMEEEFPILEAVVASIASLVLVNPLMLTATVALKWLVIGRYRAGRYPLWGTYYFRWWFVKSVLSAVPINYLAGTPLIGLYYRLLGARIGSNVHLGAEIASAIDLLSIGSDTSIGTDVVLRGHTVRNGCLEIGPITIGQGCFVGTRSIVAAGARMADNSRLTDLSLLPEGTTIPNGETWQGSPAERLYPLRSRPKVAPRSGLARRFGFALAQGVGVLVFPTIVIAAIFPGMMLMNYLNAIDEYYYYLVVSPLVAVSFVLFLSLEIAAIKWLVLGRVRSGTYSLYSGFYFRKWFVDQLLELSLDILGPLYSTVYLAPWYRLLGAKLGERAEISTASFISPDLLEIGDEGFIADCVSLGAAHVEGNTLTIAGTTIGRRSFIGNSALLPPGTVIADNCLIGCLSTPPSDGQAAREGTSWLGSPGFFLPQRQQSSSFSEATTFTPSRRLRIQRAAIEFFRVILPSTCFIALTSVLLSAVILLREEVGDGLMLLLFPLLYIKSALLAGGIVVTLKWILMGRYRPGERPLWSTFVWRNELVTALHENLADLFLVGKLTGTPMIVWFFWLLGARIGKRAWIDTTQFNEYDLVDIGDDVALNDDCTIQTHLFEDRVMKMSRIQIGDRCAVGALSLVLYDTRMSAGSQLGDLSLLMKNETLPENTRWQGIPARPAAQTAQRIPQTR